MKHIFIIIPIYTSYNFFTIICQDGSFPPAIKMLQAQDYTLKILIKRDNIENNIKIYEVNGIFVGWKLEEQNLQETQTIPNTTTSTTTVIFRIYRL